VLVSHNIRFKLFISNRKIQIIYAVIVLNAVQNIPNKVVVWLIVYFASVRISVSSIKNIDPQRLY
jgi:hypothetical protein